MSDFPDEKLEICQFQPDEIDRISEEDIDDNILSPIVPLMFVGILVF